MDDLHFISPSSGTRNGGRRGRRRHRGQRGGPPAPPTPALTGTPEIPPSPAVFTTDASRARWPWLPRRVIAGSVWRGPGHERVRVDERGEASPWPKRPQ
ncbi:hypothetical protein [Anaeromyxobacter paludicola]|uniref:Uncharacterized protein n=1 Tax=Anaeromyxobacter paludicola TaxID=2918171 RepID=A0ABM7XFL1_9BACT|nr:hypothetical protein [Anaeromyxobacter paludicola]BDG10699.1 hypothetical protein AMPC_38120 [Anaeromyxobacter paludicola]